MRGTGRERLWGLFVVGACSAETAPAPHASAARVEDPEWSRTIAGVTLATGDFDGDGDVDRVVAVGDQVEPQLNDGHGVFAAGDPIPRPRVSGLSWPPYDEIIESHEGAVVADVDRDGYGDIILWSSSIFRYYFEYPNEGWTEVDQYGFAGIQVFRGGPVGIAPQTPEMRNLSAAVLDIRVTGDHDGDGDADYCALISGAEIADPNDFIGYLDSSDPDWMNWTPPSVDNGTLSSVPCAGDINGDGLSDRILGSDGELGVRWAFGRPGIMQTRSGPLPWVPDGTWEPTEGRYDPLFGRTTRGAFVQGIGDVNGDGYDDVVSVDQVGVSTVDWLAGGPDGLMPVGRLVSDSSDRMLADGVVVADVDGDGNKDIVVLTVTREDQRLLLIYPAGDGELRPTGTVAVQGTPSRLAAPGDVDGDGLEDLLIGDVLVLSELPGDAPGTPGAPRQQEGRQGPPSAQDSSHGAPGRLWESAGSLYSQGTWSG